MDRNVFLCIFILLITSMASGATNVTEDIEENTNWTTEGSPYYIMNDIEVRRWYTLSIEAGVQVHFTGNYQIDVEGRLVARGNSLAEVEFVSEPGSKGELYFDYTGDQEGSALSYCIVNNTRLVSYERPVNITNSVLSGMDAELESGNYTSYISNNTFRQCSGSIVIQARMKDVYVMQNEFRNCTPELRGRDLWDTYVILHNNTIQNNTYGVVLKGLVEATRNSVYNNTYGIRIDDAYGSTIIDHNLIFNNSVGIYVVDMYEGNIVSHNTITRNGIGIFMADISGAYYNNNLHQNSDYGARLIDIEHVNPGVEIDMMNNWWGITDNYDLGDYTYDFYENPDLSEIIYRPYLYSMVCDAPLIDPVADSDCDGIVSDFELLDFIERWLDGEVEDSYLLNAIDVWASG